MKLRTLAIGALAAFMPLIAFSQSAQEFRFPSYLAKEMPDFARSELRGLKLVTVEYSLRGGSSGMAKDEEFRGKLEHVLGDAGLPTISNLGAIRGHAPHLAFKLARGDGFDVPFPKYSILVTLTEPATIDRTQHAASAESFSAEFRFGTADYKPLDLNNPQDVKLIEDSVLAAAKWIAARYAEANKPTS